MKKRGRTTSEPQKAGCRPVTIFDLLNSPDVKGIHPAGTATGQASRIMINSARALKIGPFDPAIKAAVLAADRVLGWQATRALLWLVDSSVHTRRVFISGGELIFEAAQGEETSFRFAVTGQSIRGWNNIADFELSPTNAFARSSGRHWVSIRLVEGGGVDFDVDADSSTPSWADTADWETGEPRRKDNGRLKRERIARLLAAM